MTFTTPLHSWIHYGTQEYSEGPSSQRSRVFRHVAAHRKLKQLRRSLNLRASALDVYKTFQVPDNQLPEMEKQLHGPDDPFDSLPIPATLEISQLVRFDRLHVSPALSGLRIPLHPSSTYLQDELAVYGFLARIAAIKVRCTQDSAASGIMLKFKGEAMRLIRLNLTDTALLRLPRAVMSLLYTEMWSRNIEATAVHMRLLEDINNQYGLDIDDLICVLYSDIQHATLVLENPLFTMDDWAWDILTADITTSLKPEGGLHEDIRLPLRWLLIEMKQALLALDLLRLSDMPKNVRQGAAAKILQVMSLLLKQYNLSADSAEQYTALAALYRIRLEANMEQIPLCGIKVFDAAKEILPRLRKRLTTASNDPPDLRLWVLFVGATSGDSWLRQEFKKEVEELGFGNPSGIRSILDRFEHRDLRSCANIAAETSASTRSSFLKSGLEDLLQLWNVAR